jgi:membrane-bound lytic murein transglycosylase D
MQPSVQKCASSSLKVTCDGRELVFTNDFDIGRGETSTFRILNEYVSRKHAEITCVQGQWWINDTGSANGLFISGSRVTAAPIADSMTVRLGVGGPFVTLSVHRPEPGTAPAPKQAASDPGQRTILAGISDRYFGKDNGGAPAGERTIMIRRAFDLVQKKQRRRNMLMFTVLGIALICAAAFGYHQRQRASRSAVHAQEMFYAIKTLDVDIARVENKLARADPPQSEQNIAEDRLRRRNLEQNYERYLTASGLYDPKMSEKRKLILRVARIFGEYELATPASFEREVETYIAAWRATPKFVRGISRANEKGYTPVIVREFLKQNLPTQFFYLALQESEFDEYVSGPRTRKGFAKGMWQFIPETAAKYGLRIGPFVDYPRVDPVDERHQWAKATAAAARYIKDIYATDAQASGLLVMASYNWGEQNVVPLLRSLPANPRERNFWRLITEHSAKLPDETYRYVLSIFSAAVIGENPRLFGLNLDNPLIAAERDVNGGN